MTTRPRRHVLSLLFVAVYVLASALLLFVDLGISDRKRQNLLFLLMLGAIAVFSAIGVVRKLSTQTYEDGGGVHHRDSDPVTYWYLVAFNVLGIVAFIAIAVLTAMDFA
ncbi:MAG: hypothetical protein QM698_09820 [Micropepsaceae bacterium]